MIISKTIDNNKKNTVLKLSKVIKLLVFCKTSKTKLKSLSYLFARNNYSLKSKLKSQNSVNYVVSVVLSPTNTFVTVNDVRGNVIVSASAGLIKLTKFQKRSQPTAVMNIFKHILAKVTFLQNKTISVHFKNVKRFHESLILTSLKPFFVIKSFQSNNLSPHNGCRPKKLKRIKRRTKRLVLK